MMSDKLVTIARFDDPLMAHIAQAKLESEGIESFITDENIAGTYSLLSNTLGGVKLQVKESLASKAVELIDQKDVEE